MHVNTASPKFIDNEDMERTALLLANFLRYPSRARSFGLSDLDSKREALLAPDGPYPYQNEMDDERRFLEDVLYIQLFDRVHLLIDDFGSLCHALSGDLSRFAEAMLNRRAPKGVFERLDEASWRILLRYGDLETLDVPSRDHEFIERIRARNVEVRMRFVRRLRHVLDTYGWLHAKFKHGHLLLYAMDAIEIDGDRAVVIPVIRDSRNPDNLGWIVFTEQTYRIWQQLHNDLIAFSRDLVLRNLRYIRRRGIGLVEPSAMSNVPQDDKDRLEYIVLEADKRVTEYPAGGDKRLLAPPYTEARRQIKMMLDIYDDSGIHGKGTENGTDP